LFCVFGIEKIVSLKELQRMTRESKRLFYESLCAKEVEHYAPYEIFSWYRYRLDNC
jgi:hypothetical protein